MSLNLYLTEDGCGHCGHSDDGYDCNITHNLTDMAAEGGIYKLLWRPEENGIKNAGQLIEPLRKAIADMEAEPARFKVHNAPNGWGLYKHFLPWLVNLLDACERMPDATVRASV
jgi:hypothetical protein